MFFFHFETVIRREKQEMKIIWNLAQKPDEVVDEPAEEPIIMGAPQTHDEEEVINILKMVTMVVMMVIVKMMIIVMTMRISWSRKQLSLNCFYDLKTGETKTIKMGANNWHCQENCRKAPRYDKLSDHTFVAVFCSFVRFLAVEDSSIGDVVTEWVSELTFDFRQRILFLKNKDIGSNSVI